MFTALPLVLLGLSLLGLFLYWMSVYATVKHTGRSPFEAPDESLPPISLLKPLKGLEEGLEANLRTFYEQDYPAPVEIVFASTEAKDPALEIARRIAAEYPGVSTRFMHSDNDFGLNPKVSNLEGALRGASHSLVLQSDANVRVRRDYLRRVVSELVVEEGHLLSSLVVGVGEETLGAMLHNLQLSAFIAPGCCFALRYFNIPCVIGKSMLFYKRDLEEVGGLALVRDILAEDYVLGRAFQAAGKKVLLSTTTAENVNVESTVESFFSRHTRWLKMRATIHIPGFLGDVLANSTALSLVALVSSGFDPMFAAVFVMHMTLKGAGDAYLLRRTRGEPLKLRYAVLTPLRDITMLLIWPYAAFSRSIEWRGTRLRLGWNTRLRPDEGALPVRMVRRIFAS